MFDSRVPHSLLSRRSRGRTDDMSNGELPASFNPLFPIGKVGNIVAPKSLWPEKGSWLTSAEFGETVEDFVTAHR